MADYAFSLKQLDATQVILKEKGLKEILLDVFNKPNKIPLDEVKRIIDNYFDGLKKELEDPLYDTLSSLEIRDKETISSVSMLLKKYMS